MGFLRVLLALSVLIAHSEQFFGIELIGGRLAVETFYIISGFYMSLVLNEKYNKIKNSYKLFITNRFLRLLPVYWVVLIATIALAVTSGVLLGKYGALETHVNHYSKLNFLSKLYFAFTNLFIVGQDAGYFMKLNAAGALQFASDFRNSDPRVYHFFIVAPAWTLSPEFMFYMMAPFLVRLKKAVLYTIIPVCLIFKIITLSQNLNFDPWTYRFFPFELMFFLLGIVSYRIYTSIKHINIHPYLSKSILPFLTLFIILFNHLPGSYVKEAIYFATVFITVPFIYNSTKANKTDRYIAEYSYPIYIIHFLILDVVNKLVKMHLLPKQLVSEVSFIFCIIFSYLLIRFISNKVEAYREKRVVEKINFKEGRTLSAAV